jgi:hypothetical protein
MASASPTLSYDTSEEVEFSEGLEELLSPRDVQISVNHFDVPEKFHLRQYGLHEYVY